MSRREHRLVGDEFDVVMLALPHYWLGQIEWDDPGLRSASRNMSRTTIFPPTTFASVAFSRDRSGATK